MAHPRDLPVGTVVNPGAADFNIYPGPGSSGTHGHLPNAHALHPPSPQDVNPRTPPPSYASLVPPPGPYPTTYPYYTPTMDGQASTSRVFGPTPLPLNLPSGLVVSGTLLLPYAYYDAAAADVRARRRFVESVLCGVGVWLLVGVVLVLEVVGEGGRW